MKIHVTKIVRSENVLLAVFAPSHGWAGSAVVDGQPQMFPGREEKTVDLWVTSPMDAAKQLGLVLPNNQHSMLRGSIKMKSMTMYAVIRVSSDGHKWLDTNTLASLREEAQLKADNMDNELPQWSKNNRQIKVTETTLIYAN